MKVEKRVVEKEVETYIAFDNTVFTNQKECEVYELNAKHNQQLKSAKNLIAKNGIDWTAMGLIVYGDCPKYECTCKRDNTAYRNTSENITHKASYHTYSRLLSADRGTEKYIKGTLCDEWRDFKHFDKWYQSNHYIVPNEKMGICITLFDINNSYISPETTCYLPESINSFFYYLPRALRTGAFFGINKMPNSTYYIKFNDKIIAYSNSKQEILEIREAILKKQITDIANKYKQYIPVNIYNRLISDKLYMDIHKEVKKIV